MSNEFGFEPFSEISDKKWDVFISHASEDKDNFVRPLAELLYLVKLFLKRSGLIMS